MGRRACSIGLSIGVVLFSTACTYDFDEPFSKPVPGAGGATASGSTGGSTTSTGASGGSDGGAHGGEQCANGADDDADGLADCADPDCVDFECVAAAPRGWSGPSPFALGQDGAQCPPDATPIAGGTTPIAGGASCSLCACDALMGGACGMPTTDVYTNSFCGNQPYTTLMPSQPSTCESWLAADPSNGALGSAVPVTTPPSCAASGGALDARPPAFAATAVVCATPLATGCDAGQVCVAKPGSSFAACIHQDGDVAACPTGYGQRTVFYLGLDDTRGCSACACDASSATCTGTTNLYSDSGCPGGPDSVVVHGGGLCVPFPTQKAQVSFEYIPDPGPQGSCVASGGQLTGAVDPLNPVTVCCPD